MSTVSGHRALAQSNIVADDTLGTENSLVIENFNGLPIELITGGAARGQNLFHSFVEFNVSEGRGAYFSSPADIQNILARVTGSNRSEILGTLGTLGDSTPNLFLINPNGIIFGENASLDVGGSFVATTANAIGFGNQGFFSATEPEAPPLLSVNPSAFFFNQMNAVRIENRSIASAGFDLTGFPLYGLRVPNGRSLLLVGGDIAIDGGRMNALGGRVELAGVKGSGMVGLNIDDNILSLSFPEGITRADASLINGARVNVRAGGGGSITVNAGNLELKEGSLLLAGIGLDVGTLGAQAGDIEIKVTDTVSFTNGSIVLASTFGQGDAGNVRIQAETVSFDEVSGVITGVEKNGKGTGGTIDITTSFLSLTNGAGLQTSTWGKGDAGNVRIQADTVSFDGGSSDGRFASGAFSYVYNNAEGQSGVIDITTNFLSVTNGAQLVASTNGKGGAGSVRIQADSVSFDGGSSDGAPSAAYSTVEKNGEGQGGVIDITTGSLSVTNGAQLTALTRGNGNAGSVKIQADIVSFDGISSDGRRPSAVLNQVRENAQGRGGVIDITTGYLFITNGGQLSVSTLGQGDAGSVRIQASNRVSFDGVNGRFNSAALSAVRENASGQGGSIDITTASLSVTNGAVLSVGTLGKGKAGNITVTANAFEAINGGQLVTATLGSSDAGNITLNVRDSITLVGPNSGLFTNTEKGSTGNGGSIFISNPASVMIRDGARVAVDSEGTGIGGNIEIQAGSVTLENEARLLAETASNTGGNITLQLQDLLLLRNESKISTNAGTAQAGGDGGNISIKADFIVAVPVEDSDITANAFEGRGGNINITTQGIYGLEFREELTPLSDITASSQFGVDGELQLDLLTNVDPSQGLAALPTNVVDPSQQIAQGCAPRGERTSRFVATGRGGLPLSPDEPLRERAIITPEWVTLDAQAQSTANSRQARRDDQMDAASSSPTEIVEADGWVLDAKGNVVLVARSQTTDSLRSNTLQSLCHHP